MWRRPQPLALPVPLLPPPEAATVHQRAEAAGRLVVVEAVVVALEGVVDARVLLLLSLLAAPLHWQRLPMPQILAQQPAQQSPCCPPLYPKAQPLHRRWR